MNLNNKEEWHNENSLDSSFLLSSVVFFCSAFRLRFIMLDLQLYVVLSYTRFDGISKWNFSSVSEFYVEFLLQQFYVALIERDYGYSLSHLFRIKGLWGPRSMMGWHIIQWSSF